MAVASCAQGLPEAVKVIRMASVEDSSSAIIDTCPSCGGAIDVTDELPFAQIFCPHCGAGMRARRMFNHFELVELIGEGGMGSVFKAYDHSLERMVALKVLRREMSAREEERSKIEQEARITASVNHPHVVRVYSFGEACGQFYLAMELVDKGSLDDLMSIQTRVPEAQVLEIGIQIAQGLEAALEKGLIHRDVKPGNILFADSHATKIVDFGLARVLEEEAGARGEIWGTPYYIAPERLNYDPEDFRSDMYSLGGTLFHAIAGRPPFEAESASMVALKQIKSQRVSLEAFAPDVAPETAYVINRMLERKPGDRYASYAELVEHLEFARAKVMERAGRPTGAKRREVVKLETKRTRLYGVLLFLAVLFLTLGGAVFFVLKSRSEGAVALREGIEALWVRDSLSVGIRALAEGKYDKAQELLKQASAEAPARSERGTRAKLNYALALTLSGQREHSIEQMQEIVKQGLFSDSSANHDLANAFLYAADFGSRSRVIPLMELHNYPREGAGALALFFAGISNHANNHPKEADELFTEFLAVEPPQDVPSWSSYQKIARRLKASP